jgi:quinol monooxygenase YgiN
VITVVARLKVKAGQNAAFEEAARAMIAHVTANEPDTLTYVLHRHMGDETTYVFYEVYRTPEALQAHGASPAMMQFFGAAGPLLDGQPVIETFSEVAGKR